MTKKLLPLIVGLAFASTARTQTTPPANSSLTDAQVAEVLITINEGEIDAAKIAQSKTKNKEVKDFAKMMADQHKENKEETKKVAQKNSISPHKSDLSKSLQDDAKNSNKDLKKAKAFDKSYVDQQVSMHEKALDTLDKTLIPSAQNADLKSHLEKTKQAVSTHLDEAKALQGKL